MMDLMGRGAAAVVAELAVQGRIHGLLAVGGSGGSSVAAPTMQRLYTNHRGASFLVQKVTRTWCASTSAAIAA